MAYGPTSAGSHRGTGWVVRRGERQETPPTSKARAETPYSRAVDAKPLMRGWLHVGCFFLAVPIAVALVFSATSVTARVAAGIYGVGVVALFGVSGSYHRGRWSPVWRSRMQRLDHTTIFVTIASSYTPICLLVLEGWLGRDARRRLERRRGRRHPRLDPQPSRQRRPIRAVHRPRLGRSRRAPQLVGNLTGAQLALIAVGGVLFTVGAIFLASNWPDPFPRVFGYHEIWHVLVVAIACHMVAIASVIRAPAPPDRRSRSVWRTNAGGDRGSS